MAFTTIALNQDRITSQSEDNIEFSYDSPKIYSNADQVYELSIERFIDESTPKLDFIYNIENNENVSLSDTIVTDINAYKKTISNKRFEIIENKFLTFVEKSDIKKIHESFLSKFSRIKNIKSNILGGILEKTDRVKRNSFESKLKKFILNKEVDKNFNFVLNTFKNNLSSSSNDVYQNRVFFNENQYQDLDVIDYLNNNFSKNTLIYFKEPNSFDFVKPVKTTTNDIIIQNFINLSRSMFTISTGCFLKNLEDDKFKALNFDLTSNRNIISENENFKIFDAINEKNNKLISTKITRDSILKQKIIDSKFKINSITLENISELNGLCFFNNEINNYLDTIIADRKNLYKSSINNGSSIEVEVVALNDCFIGNIFDLDIGTLNNSHLLKIHENIYSGQSEDSTEAFNKTIKPLIKNIVVSNQKKINLYFNNKPVFDVLEKSISNNLEKIVSVKNKKDLCTDFNTNIDELTLKTKIDSIVKKVKLTHLKNKNVDLEFIKEIIANIKKSESYSLLSYCKEDTENISVINSENKVFDFLFTQDDEEENLYYSHSDIKTNHRINNVTFKGIDSLKKKELDFNEERETFKDNFLNLLSHYYPKNKFYSSTIFYKNILESLKKELDVSENYDDISLCQALYFNQIVNQDDSSNLEDIVSKRFLKEAIRLDSVTDESIRTLEFSDFTYNLPDQGDYDMTSESGIRSYLNAILNSSENLKVIRKLVFGKDNFKKLNEENNFLEISNLNLTKNPIPVQSATTTRNTNNVLVAQENEVEVATDVRDFNTFSIRSDSREATFFGSDYQINNNETFGNQDSDNNQNSSTSHKVYLTGILFKSFISNYNFMVNFRTDGKLSEVLNFKLDVKTRNNIIKDESGEEETFKIDTSYLDITNSKKIKVKVCPFINDSFNRSTNNLPGAVVSDLFNEACRTEKTVFNNICLVIKDMLRLIDTNYSSSIFENEEDIEKYVTSQKNAVNFIKKIIRIYADFYLLYYSRISKSNFLKLSKSLPLDIQYTNPGNVVNNRDFPSNGIVSKNKDFNSSYRHIEDLPELTFQPLKNLVLIKDIVRIINSFNENPNQFLNNTDLDTSYNVDFWNTKETSKIQNILSSLYRSDINQAFYFDIIKELIAYQDKIQAATREDISSSKFFNQLKEVLNEDLSNKIEENFYDIFYVNKLSKAIFKDEYLNKKIQENIENNTENNNLDFYTRSDFFKNQKEFKENYFNKQFNFSSNDYSKEFFGENKNDYLNSNIYTFGLKNESLRNRSYDTIIKITVSIVDQLNLNRYYIPKVYLFSPLFTKLPNIIASDFNIETNDTIGFYDLNKNIDQRFKAFKISDNLNNNQQFIKILFKKFSLERFEEAQEIYRYILYCHLGSNFTEDLSHNIYDMSFKSNTEKIIENNVVFDQINKLNNKDFYSIFKNKKEKSINSLKKNDLILKPSSFKSVEEENSFYDLLNELDKIGSTKNINSMQDEVFYDQYSIAVNPKNFYYIDVSESESGSIIHENNELQNIVEKIIGVSLTSEQRRKSNNKISNFNVIVETEIL